jgi:catalase
LARIPIKGAGIEVAEDVDKVFTANLATALGLHRAWDRAPKVMASAVPPSVN